MRDPDVFAMRPAMILSSVVLPEPFFPQIIDISFLQKVNVTELRATFVPYFLVKDLIE